MKIDKGSIRSVLLITLSNLGDIILTTPVLEKLHEEFPKARIDVITGAPGEAIFLAHPAVRRVDIHKGRKGLKGRIRQLIDLRQRRYDMVVDLKNSMLPYLIGARFHSDIACRFRKGLLHKMDEHLLKLNGMGMERSSGYRFFVPVSADEKKFVDGVISALKGKVVVMNPGAKSHLKRWPYQKYAELSDRLVSRLQCNVLLTGNEDDREVISSLIACAKERNIDLCGKTSIGALAELIQRADLLITNDSAPLHVASAVNAPTIAIFGPSDERKYGPVSEKRAVIAPGVSCRPCGKALCAIGPDEGCIIQVSVDNVFNAAKTILSV